MSLTRVTIAPSAPSTATTSRGTATRAAYEVLVGPGALEAVGEAWAACTGKRVALLTDSNVAPLLATGDAWDTYPSLVVEAGEDSKSLARLGEVLDFMAEADLERDSILVALGGGVIGDLGGLAASLYMRGIDVVQCPTTLLAQADAAVGGKTAINLAAGKNLAGTFHRPLAVFCDTRTLATLPRGELRSGLGEVLKTALLEEGELLHILVSEGERLLAADSDLFAEIIVRCVRLKGDLVAQDEHEAGARKALNLGHTFAHGIEHAAGFGTIPHGEAVATGLVLALETSRRMGSLEDPELPSVVVRLLEQVGLAADLAGLRERHAVELSPEAIVRGMRHDKKGSRGRPLFVLPLRLGRVELDQPVDPSLLEELLA